MSSDNPSISIIIPVYNDSERLSKCLEAIHQQEFSGSYEVIVVDNGSEDFSHVERMVHSYPGMVCLQELKTGSYAARNLGIRESKGDVLAFTDSDCIPFSGWLHQGKSFLESNTDVALLAGKVEVFFHDEKNPTSTELYEKVFAFQQETSVERGEAATANLLVRRNVFDEIGLFESNTYSGGDYEFSRKATTSGFKLKYGGSVKVFHPARSRLSDYRHKLKRVHGGAYVLRSKNPRMASRFSLKSMLKNSMPPVEGIMRTLEVRTDHDLSGWDVARIIYVLFHNKYYSFFYRLFLMIGNDKKLVR